ncbi:hypothetical protein B296_00003049 [Ensete ventricosum]|uniref:Uncharacterized protein n=1 Tax=Ensete ventricosum TaxID=4639 RepID=A0A426ZEZ2_ENSVE|nr:hypothetical protein B296_00003049 [Ensete ventricosum]
MAALIRWQLPYQGATAPAANAAAFGGDSPDRGQQPLVGWLLAVAPCGLAAGDCPLWASRSCGIKNEESFEVHSPYLIDAFDRETEVTQLTEAKLGSEGLSRGQEDAEAGTLEEYAKVLSF